MLIIHDVDRMHLTDVQLNAHMSSLITSGYRALEELKRCGDIAAYGAGVNHIGSISSFLDAIDLDFFMVAQVGSRGESKEREGRKEALEVGKGRTVSVGAIFFF